MSALGIGIDVVDVDRLAQLLCRHEESFLRRVLTERERMGLPPAGSQRLRAIAGLFAAKEAASKALGVGFSQGFPARTFEIYRQGARMRVRSIRPEWSGIQLAATVAHTGGLALAIAVAAPWNLTIPREVSDE